MGSKRKHVEDDDEDEDEGNDDVDEDGVRRKVYKFHKEDLKSIEWDLELDTGMTEKKDDNWGKLTKEAQQQCIKSVVRLFVLAGSRKEPVSRAKVRSISTSLIHVPHLNYLSNARVAGPGAGHAGKGRRRLQEAGRQGALRGTSLGPPGYDVRPIRPGILTPCHPSRMPLGPPGHPIIALSVTSHRPPALPLAFAWQAQKHLVSTFGYNVVSDRNLRGSQAAAKARARKDSGKEGGSDSHTYYVINNLRSPALFQVCFVGERPPGRAVGRHIQAPQPLPLPLPAPPQVRTDAAPPGWFHHRSRPGPAPPQVLSQASVDPSLSPLSLPHPPLIIRIKLRKTRV